MNVYDLFNYLHGHNDYEKMIIFCFLKWFYFDNKVVSEYCMKIDPRQLLQDEKQFNNFRWFEYFKPVKLNCPLEETFRILRVQYKNIISNVSQINVIKISVWYLALWKKNKTLICINMIKYFIKKKINILVFFVYFLDDV